MRTVHAVLADTKYDIFVGAGAVALAATAVTGHTKPAKIALVADETVFRLHGATLLRVLPIAPTCITVPAGEASKSLESAARIYDRLAEARIAREDLVVAFGGGMIGDLAGFVAATWLRGVRWVLVPTTMEAAIDASVGGKTGVNHARGKNLIGAFHQPAGVFVDLDFFATLPQRDLVGGLAESVKHAVTRAPDFLSWQEAHAAAIVGRDADVLEELIARNGAIKLDVVALDERERGPRVVLNHGHTIGHAVEHVLGYDLRHGECVGLGMIVENEIARTRGRLAAEVCERVVRLLERFDLPTRLPRRLDPAAVLDACRLDKKARGGSVHFVLVCEPGRVERAGDVTDAEIVAALERVQPAA